MSKVSKFEKHNLKAIRDDVDAALKIVCHKYGITLHLGNISFTEQTFTGKLNAAVVDSATGVAVTPEELALKQHYKHFLGEKFVEGTVYMHRGKRIKFVGIQTRSHKYPVIFQDVATGKRYKMEEDDARKIVDPSYVSMWDDKEWQGQTRL